MALACPFGTPPVLAPTTKGDMYALYDEGKFGNQLLTWKTLDDYLASDYPDKVVLRYRIKESPYCAYGLTREEVVAQVNKWCKEGAKYELFTLNELAADDKLTIQGEIRQSSTHLSLRYSLVATPMRAALKKEERNADGMKVEAILKHYLDPIDYEFLMELLDKYQNPVQSLEDPKHNVVIEFSVWGCKVGTWNRRMVVWEIRAGY